ncbi:MAG: carbamate kinase [Clostridia bacterium]|nr:carbamate kinase [Clostridia bacterium]
MKLVVALGGNALGNTPEEQKQLVVGTAKSIIDLVEQGHSVVLTHGNGPQVGMINVAFDTAHTQDTLSPSMPFAECGAMSQGYIGYHLQNALQTELANRNIRKSVVSLITQVVVDKNDKGFSNPTKPIGIFMTKEQADQVIRDKGYTVKYIADKDKYRRVVASPKPIDIVEKEAVSTLIDSGAIVITVGGGGIPVVKDGNQYVGVPAVIDKDYASALLAKIINADKLVILTAVDKVSINYATPNQVDLDTITVSQCDKYIEQGQFGVGSMLPKVQAALSFVKGSGKQAIIADLTKCEKALSGNGGTQIIDD